MRLLLPGLDPGEYLVDGSGKVAYKVEENFPATLKVDPAQAGAPEKLKGPAGELRTRALSALA